MTDPSSPSPLPTRRRYGGPNPGILALVSAVLTVGGIAAGAAVSGGQLFVSPFAPGAEVLQHFQRAALGSVVSATLQFASAIPLGIFSATVYARQLRLGIRVPGPVISLFGGTSAAIMLMVSSLLTWTLGQDAVLVDEPLVVALSFLRFLTGGVGFVAGIGLLVAGIAVPALVLRLVRPWLAWSGLAIAALSEIAVLSLALEPLHYLLPVGRFGGLLWLIAIGFLLPVTRTDTSSPRDASL